MDLELTSHAIRLAIWNRLVSFTSQGPFFEKQMRLDI
jgi:hypothetical protein